MASSANPYDNHYESARVEDDDDDLIDPDDGKQALSPSPSPFALASNKHPQRI